MIGGSMMKKNDAGCACVHCGSSHRAEQLSRSSSSLDSAVGFSELSEPLFFVLLLEFSKLMRQSSVEYRELRATTAVNRSWTCNGHHPRE